MKAIHGGKAKNDKIDAQKIAVLLRGGMFPQAYVYPTAMRATRDLLRRRCHLARKRAELLAHIPNTNSQYNLPEIGKRLANKANREEVAEHFPDPSVRKAIAVDVSLIDHYDQLFGRGGRLSHAQCQSCMMCRRSPGCNRSPGLGRCWLWSSFLRVRTFRALSPRARFCLVLSASEMRQRIEWQTTRALQAKRLATSIYAGPLPKPPCFSSARVSPGKGILRNSNTNTAKPKR